MKHFEDAFARLPEPLRRERAHLFAAFRAQGLPSKKEEDWRYTDVSSLAERAFEPAEPLHPALPTLAGAETLAFANGHLVAGDRALVGEALPDETSGAVVALNGAFATGGLDLAVPANATRGPLHLVTWFGGAPERMAHLRHRVRLARGARAVVILHELGDDAQPNVGRQSVADKHGGMGMPPYETGAGGKGMPPYVGRQSVADAGPVGRQSVADAGPVGRQSVADSFFATQVFDIELAEGSQLELYRIQQFGRGTSALTRVDVRQGRDSRFTSVSLHGGGALVRNDINVSLDAPGAEAELHGVLVPAPGEHLDVHTRLDHRAPQGRSRESFRAIVPEKTRAIFNGKVIVHPGAQKTDSEQHVDSLLLSPGAEVNAKPELEIYADDVKCAHGATCGQLDEDAIYYLRSRGVELQAARNLLLFTFAHRILQRIAFEPARKLAEQALLGRLPGGATLGELL